MLDFVLAIVNAVTGGSAGRGSSEGLGLCSISFSKKDSISGQENCEAQCWHPQNVCHGVFRQWRRGLGSPSAQDLSPLLWLSTVVPVSHLCKDTVGETLFRLAHPDPLPGQLPPFWTTFQVQPGALLSSLLLLIHILLSLGRMYAWHLEA